MTPRRTKIGPGEFFLARPAQGDGLIRRLGEPRSLDGAFAGMFAAETATKVRDHDTHMFLRHVKGASEFGANPKRVLRAGPDGQLAIIPFRDRRARFQRRVLDVGDMIVCARGFAPVISSAKDSAARRPRRSV